MSDFNHLGKMMPVWRLLYPVFLDLDKIFALFQNTDKSCHQDIGSDFQHLDDIHQQVERKVLEYRSQICRVLKAPDVLQWMPGFLTAADEIEIKAVDARSPEKASFLLIDRILKCTYLGKWKAFLEALDNADYTYLVSLLKSNVQDPEHCNHQKKILQIFAPYLGLQLEPCDLIFHLNASDLINARDMEEIKACQRNRGSVAATILMLDRIQRRQAPSRWYTDFLKILYQKGFKDIVREMEPEFTLDCEILKSPNIRVTDASDSDIEVDEFGYSVEEKIETKVRYFQSEITELLKVEKIAPALCQLIDIEKVCQILQLSANSRKESIESMLEEIGKLKSKTKWRTFITCLRESDYPHLADLLSRPRTTKLQCRERDLLRLFHSSLGEQLDPNDLIMHLEKDNAINHRDIEEIHVALQQSGKTAASLVLIECLQCRLVPAQWFTAFLNALHACGRDDIVQTIYPEYLKMHTYQSDAAKISCFNEDKSTEDSDLVNRIDAAHCHIYKLEKYAKLQLSKLQQHFDDMRNSLQSQIENRTVAMSKTLEHVTALTGRQSEEDIKQEIEKSVQQVMSACYSLHAMDPFVNLVKLGVLQESKHTLCGQKSTEVPTKVSGPLKKGATLGNRKDRIFNARTRHFSGSSSSSLSSGYLLVEKASSLSNSSASSVNEGSKTKSVPKSTFAEVSKDTAQEKRDKKPTKLDNDRFSSLLIQDKDYLALYSKRKTYPGRRRTVSEYSLLSTDASIVSSTDIPSSSFTDALYDTSTISSTTKTTSASEKKILVERTESYLYHHRIVVNCKNNCLLSSLCVLPNSKTVLVDQGNGCFYIYDDASKKLIHRRLNRHIPTCVCNVGDNCLFILFRRRDCKHVLVQCHIHYSTTSNHKRIVRDISFEKVRLTSKCDGQLCSIAGSNNCVIAFCSKKHMHFISTGGQETEVAICDIVENEWWPNYSIVDSGCEFAFIYDIYSCSVYCYCIFTGQITWKVKLPHVEGLTLCGESIYLSVNIDNKIEVLSKSTGGHERVITENVRRPFAVSSSPGQETIIVTQYHPKGNKMNRIIKYF